MNTFAKESGGMHFAMTFQSEIPGYLNSINALLRSQYSLAYDLAEEHEPGKKYKLQVKVDVDGDGVYDEKQLLGAAPAVLCHPGGEKAPTVRNKPNFGR